MIRKILNIFENISYLKKIAYMLSSEENFIKIIYILCTVSNGCKNIDYFVFYYLFVFFLILNILFVKIVMRF